VARAWR